MPRLAGVLLLGLLLPSAPAGADDKLAEARAYYNQQLYELAMKSAELASGDQAAADEAGLILARANLERFRQTHDTTNLTAAREALQKVDPTRLSAPSQAEFTVGLGEWLFLDDRYGPAARDRVLDWWATSIDRHAQVTPAHRSALYQRIIDRMDEELRDHPGSTAAAYWVPAAARSLGDLDRAWTAAIAGWLRSRVGPDHGVAVRADLDRLVQTAIIPERARELSHQSHDAKDAVDVMTTEWETLKQQWN